MGMAIPIDRVYLQTGVIYHDYPLNNQLQPQRPWNVVPQYAMLVFWPRALDWLRVQMSILPSSPTAPEQPFTDRRDAIENICRIHGVEPAQVIPAGFLNQQMCLAGSVVRDSRLRFRCEIDTSHDGFRTLAKTPRPENRKELVVPVQVMFFDAKALGTYFDQKTTLDLILRPAVAVPQFAGVVAIDLGNTSSTLACINKSDAIYRTDSIKLLLADVLRGELREQSEPTGSEVRITRITSTGDLPTGTRVFPSVPADEKSQSVEFTIGRTAVAPGAGQSLAGLILGAKRLLANKDWNDTRKIVTRHRHMPETTEHLEEIEVRNRLPAELLVSRLLERFRQAALGWPADVAITYPTTYTPREINQLSQAIERAWLRMQGQAQSLGGDTAMTDDQELNRLTLLLREKLNTGEVTDDQDSALLALKVDEASAAAFFFLYRRIFESPGGLLRFRYLYPQGLNLLLYDCGGGTTDIALVCAKALAKDHLVLTVRARSGLRGFGGDNITREVCRLLKAKMQVALGPVLGRPVKVTPPAKTGEGAASRPSLEEFIRKAKSIDPNDELIPTSFDPMHTDPVSLQRKEHIVELWRWAEALKIQLAESPSVKLSQVARIERHVSPLCDAILQPFNDQQATQMGQQLGSLVLHRWEIDALVYEPIHQSIRKCNTLIREVLQEKTAPNEEEVHWVVASGNASRYPLVGELLRKQLNVAFLSPSEGMEDSADLCSRFLLDTANLKHAVAKGAAMALMTMRAMRSVVRIEFNSDLARRLPFDVGYRDVARHDTIILFSEHTRYEELQPVSVPMTALAPEVGEQLSTRQTFILERRFPGDDDFTPFQAFEFPDGIIGDIEVTYDPKQHEFLTRDVGSGRSGDPRDLSEMEVKYSPVQRGDL